LFRAFNLPFGDKQPTELAGAGFQQELKGAADSPFVLNADVLKLAESFVIVENRLMIRFQI
jgi:hypothetical protein